jgi:hypothetical protein
MFTKFISTKGGFNRRRKKQLEMLKVKTTDGDGRKVMNIHHMNQIYKNINTCKLDRFSPIYTDTHVMTMWNE